MAPVSSTKSERTLEREVKDQTCEERYGSCKPQVQAKDFMQKNQQREVHSEGRSADQEELDQMAVLNNSKKFDSELLRPIP